MTSEKTPPIDNDALEKKIGAIEKEVANVKLVIRRASRTRLLLLLAVVVLIAGAIWAFYGLAMELKGPEFLGELRVKATERSKDTTDRAVKEARALAERATPILKEVFTKQVEKDRETYQNTLQAEGGKLAKNLEAELDKKIRGHFDEASVKYQAILRDEFPDLENPELLDKMYASITDIIDGLASEYYSEKVQVQLEEINNKWLAFEMAEVPKEDEASLNKQFVASLMYLAALKIDKESVE